MAPVPVLLFVGLVLMGCKGCDEESSTPTTLEELEALPLNSNVRRQYFATDDVTAVDITEFETGLMDPHSEKARKIASMIGACSKLAQYMKRRDNRANSDSSNASTVDMNALHYREKK